MWINKANELGEMIKASDIFTSYQQAKLKHDTDSELQCSVGEFNLKKMALMQEMKNEERDEEKISRFQDEMKELYADIMRNPVMSEYLKSKEELEKMVNEVYSTINFHITGKKSNGCSGSCSSCNGCG